TPTTLPCPTDLHGAALDHFSTAKNQRHGSMGAMDLVRRNDNPRCFSVVLPVGGVADRSLGRVALGEQRFGDGQNWAVADYDLRRNARPLEHQTALAYLADVNINPCLRIQ